MSATGSSRFCPGEIGYHIISLGCAKNLVDSEYLKGELAAAGFREALSSDEASLLLINTCGFITPAKEESIEIIFDMLDQRDAQSEREVLCCDGSMRPFTPAVVVFGCLTERYLEAIKKDIPEIDMVHPLDRADLVQGIAEKFSIAIPPERQRKPLPLVDMPYRYVKIAEGCSNNCTFCAIPLIRGAMKSFSPEKIERDVKLAIERGAVEIDLVAQDSASYRHGALGLPDLVRRVGGMDGIGWLRLLYLHPDHITDEILSLFNEIPSLVPYVDIPLQHVSGGVVRAMGRRGDADTYRRLIEKIRRVVDDVVIRSTFMVGFPGEGEEEFSELMAFLGEMELDRVGAFTWSPEEDTAAVRLPGRVDEGEAVERYNRLMEQQRGISEKRLQRVIGRTVDVLVEAKIDAHTYMGRTPWDAPEVDGVFYLTGSDMAINSIVPSRVTDSVEYDLIGVVD